jgi:hypothetical protein
LVCKVPSSQLEMLNSGLNFPVLMKVSLSRARLLYTNL